jgi:hypothetical protein
MREGLPNRRYATAGPSPIQPRRGVILPLSHGADWHGPVRCENSAEARISKNRRVDAFGEACGLGNLGPICKPNDTQARMTRTRAGKGRMPVEIARRVRSVSSRHDWECATHTLSLGDRQFAFGLWRSTSSLQDSARGWLLTCGSVCPRCEFGDVVGTQARVGVQREIEPRRHFSLLYHG